VDINIIALIIRKNIVMIQSNTCRTLSVSMRLFRYLTILITFLIASSCTPIVNVHGKMSISDDIQNIKVGFSKREDVIKLLGTPSTEGVLSNEVWYYFSETTQTRAFFKPKIVKRNIYALVFEKNNTVKNVVTYNEANGKEINITTRVTPSAGAELTFIQQLFFNLGRFSGTEKDLEFGK